MSLSPHPKNFISEDEYWTSVRAAAKSAREMPYWKRVDLGVNAPRTWSEMESALEKLKSESLGKQES